MLYRHTFLFLETMNYDITGLFGLIRDGDARAADELLPLIYNELRRLAAAKMARQEPGHTLQATALVHEAWMRLVDSEGRARFENRAHFFGAAAEAMRRILVDHARRKNRDKRGAGAGHCDVDDVEIAAPNGSRDELLAVHEALDRFAAHDARRAELVKLRYFVGLSFEEAADVLGISVPTANRDWAYARAWLHAEITTEGHRPGARKPADVVSLSKEQPSNLPDETWTK